MIADGTDHSHLASAKIVYMFRETPTKRGGKIVYATMSKMSAMMAALIRETETSTEEKISGPDAIVLGASVYTPDIAAQIVAEGTSEEDTPSNKPKREEFVFLMMVAWECWKALDDNKKKALVDHELCHAQGEEDEDTGDMRWFTIGHDYEGFLSNIKRFGFWTPEYQSMADTVVKIEDENS